MQCMSNHNHNHIYNHNYNHKDKTLILYKAVVIYIVRSIQQKTTRLRRRQRREREFQTILLSHPKCGDGHFRSGYPTQTIKFANS
jgi:hypothetical protein